MLQMIIIIIISVVVFLLVCWMLTEYWLRSVRKLPGEKISNLNVWNRAVYVLEDFCGTVNHKKDFKEMRVEEEMGAVHMDHEKSNHHSSIPEKEYREKDSARNEKKYNMKINM